MMFGRCNLNSLLQLFCAVCNVRQVSSFTSVIPFHRRTHVDCATRSPSLWMAKPMLPDDDTATEASPMVRRVYETFLWKRNPTGEQYNINYRVEGPEDGQPLLLVHGFGANVNHFRSQFPVLTAERYRVYAVDLLGFGASDKPANAPYSIELFQELLVDFIHAMGDKSKPWFLAGNSIGGLCCLAVAKALQEQSESSVQAQGVVLFNCAGGMSGFRYEDVSWYLRPILYFVQTVVLGPANGGRFFQNFKTRENVQSILCQQGVYCDTKNVDEELLEILLGPSDDEGAQDVFLRVFGGPAGPTPESILPTLKCPVLAIWGGKDPWTPVDRGMHPGIQFENYCNDFTLVVLENVGHCPHDENPEGCHAVMIPWMKEVIEGDPP